jgi:hypothetical protein
MKTSIVLSALAGALAGSSGARLCGTNLNQTTSMAGRSNDPREGVDPAGLTPVQLTHAAYNVEDLSTYVIRLDAPTDSPGFIGIAFSVTDSAGVQQTATFETSHWQVSDGGDPAACSLLVDVSDNTGAATRLPADSCQLTQYTHTSKDLKPWPRAVIAFQLPEGSTATQLQYLLLEGVNRNDCAAAQLAANETADDAACKEEQSWYSNTVALDSFSTDAPETSEILQLAGGACFTQEAPCERSALLETMCTALASLLPPSPSPSPDSGAPSLLAGTTTLLAAALSFF